MKLSTKGRYGLRALIDLALYSENETVSIASISARQNISESYLEQLIAKLRKAGLVTSVRGAGGGYKLAKPASEISVGDILRALEESEKRMTLEREKLELLRMRATGAVDVPDPETDGEDAEEMA